MRLPSACAAALVALLAVTSAGAATITIINNDGAGEGFNDSTGVSAVGGNSATTLGGQRLAAFQYAANLWGAELSSSVTIRVGANMDPLFCDAGSATLGQAGPTTAHGNFPGAPVLNTWYPQAVANKLSGGDLSGQDDIAATFNSAIGTTCAFPNTWYYGLDGNAPANRIDFVAVVLHEIGHGLGFLTFVDETNGARLSNLNDTYMLNLEDHSSGLLWSAMSNAQRAASAIAAGDLHWVGNAVVTNGGILSAGRHTSGHVQMYAPNPVESGSSVSHFDTACSPSQLMEPIYTGPVHALSLSRHLMTDIGWGTATGSTTTTTSTTSTSSSTSTSNSNPTTSSSTTTSTSNGATSSSTNTSTSGTLPTTTSTTLPIVEPAVCPASPIAPCATSASQRATLTLRRGSQAAKRTLRWKVARGAAIGGSALGDPVDATPLVRVCLYDTSATTQPLATMVVPPGGTCGSKPCWRRLGNGGYRYRNRAATPDGVTDMKLKTTSTGELQLAVKGKGAALPDPALPLDLPVTAQLAVGEGAGIACWQAIFTSTLRSEPAIFKAGSP